MIRSCAFQSQRRRCLSRRGFSLVELLLALAITTALLAATLVALDASYRAYQHTTRAASTHTISRLAMDRMQSLIRNGTDFGPKPADANDAIVESDLLEIIMPNGQGVVLEWVESDLALYVRLFDPATGAITASHLLLEGVVPQYDENGVRVSPFTLEYELGNKLYRATIDMVVVPDDNMSVEIEGALPYTIRLVATAMPRRVAYDSP